MRCIHLLKRVDNDEHLLVRICIHHLLTASDNIIDFGRVTTSEVTTKAKTINSLLDLEERLFSCIEDTHCIFLLSDSRSNSENHSGLTSTRLSSEESDRRRSESVTTHCRVNKVNIGCTSTVEVLGNLNVRDWSTEDKVRKFGCDSHDKAPLVFGFDTRVDFGCKFLFVLTYIM